MKNQGTYYVPGVFAEYYLMHMGGLTLVPATQFHGRMSQEPEAKAGVTRELRGGGGLLYTSKPCMHPHPALLVLSLFIDSSSVPVAASVSPGH